MPCSNRFGKQYQIIAYATNGNRPRIFNRLRIDLPLNSSQKVPRKNGVYVTDIWDDIRELTSGYFAGDEPVRTGEGDRFHKQQAPLSLLTRIILSSSLPEDTILDPFAGTGTTLIAAKQLQRKSIGVELDPKNIACIENRIKYTRSADQIDKLYNYYIYTKELSKIWGENHANNSTLFKKKVA